MILFYWFYFIISKFLYQYLMLFIICPWKWAMNATMKAYSSVSMILNRKIKYNYNQCRDNQITNRYLKHLNSIKFMKFINNKCAYLKLTVFILWFLFIFYLVLVMSLLCYLFFFFFVFFIIIIDDHKTGFWCVTIFECITVKKKKKNPKSKIIIIISKYAFEE